MKELNIFVSSTCYDLSKIRKELKEYIEDAGHNAYLSESKNFPINPSINAIDNCIDNVKNNADILVLVIGKRYGYKLKSGKSITYTEYVVARGKGIPIYTFIDGDINKTLLKLDNSMTADLDDYESFNKISEFVKEIRDVDKLWVSEFSDAQDIIAVLKNQMSWLFEDALRLRAKYNTNIDPFFSLNLSNAALKIMLEKDEYFEMRFFLQTWVDEMNKKEAVKRDSDYRILLNSKFYINDNYTIADWGRQRLSELTMLKNSLTLLFPKLYKKFYGETGAQPDLKGLYYVSETYARIFESIIVWKIDTLTTHVNDECKDFRDKLANLSSDVISKIWEFPFEQKKLIDEALCKHKDSIEDKLISSTLKLDINEVHMREFKVALEKLDCRLKQQI
jgi:hypothetical protein